MIYFCGQAVKWSCICIRRSWGWVSACMCDRLWQVWVRMNLYILLGVFDLKRRCTEWSVYDIKVPRERFESIRIHLLSHRSRSTVMSYTDHSAQRRFKSNTPNNCSGRSYDHLSISWCSRHAVVCLNYAWAPFVAQTRFYTHFSL